MDEDDKHFISLEMLLSHYMSSYLLSVNFISECQRFQLDIREKSGILGQSQQTFSVKGQILSM